MTASIGIIGTSFVDPWLLDAMLNRQQDAVRVVGFWSPPAAVSGSLDGRLRDVPVTASLDELLAISDSLYIAVPVEQRLGFVQRAMAKNKAVFCEPPLCNEIADTAHLIRHAVNARFAVNYRAPCIPSITLLQSWLKLGALGVPDRLVLSVGTPDRIQSGADGAKALLLHYLFISRRLLGAMTLRDAEIAFPYGLPSWLVPFRTGGLPALLVARGTDRAEALQPTWTLLGVGGARLRGWTALERTRPNGAWVSETPHCKAEFLHTEIAGRQINELAALSRGDAHHLATGFEAYEVEAFAERLRDILATMPQSATDARPPLLPFNRTP